MQKNNAFSLLSNILKIMKFGSYNSQFSTKYDQNSDLTLNIYIIYNIYNIYIIDSYCISILVYCSQNDR